MPDWEAIRRGRASGLSFEDLEKEYGPSKSTIHRRAKKEKWDEMGWDGEKSGMARNTDESQIRLLRNELPSPPSTLRGANLIVEDLVEILEEQRKKKVKLEIVDYLKITNALFQCNRIIVNALPEEEEGEQEDLSGFDEDELRQYAEYQERAKKRV